MERQLRAVWLGRLVLLAATIILTLVGLRGLTDPVHGLADRGISVSSGYGITTIRVATGAFPFAAGIVTLLCLVSSSRLLIGLSFTIILMAVALAARVFGILVDGSVVAENIRITGVETVVLLLAIVAVFLGARKHDSTQTR